MGDLKEVAGSPSAEIDELIEGVARDDGAEELMILLRPEQLSMEVHGLNALLSSLSLKVQENLKGKNHLATQGLFHLFELIALLGAEQDDVFLNLQKQALELYGRNFGKYVGDDNERLEGALPLKIVKISLEGTIDVLHMLVEICGQIVKMIEQQKMNDVDNDKRYLPFIKLFQTEVLNLRKDLDRVEVAVQVDGLVQASSTAAMEVVDGFQSALVEARKEGDVLRRAMGGLSEELLGSEGRVDYGRLGWGAALDLSGEMLRFLTDILPRVSDLDPDEIAAIEKYASHFQSLQGMLGMMGREEVDRIMRRVSSGQGLDLAFLQEVFAGTPEIAGNNEFLTMLGSALSAGVDLDGFLNGSGQNKVLSASTDEVGVFVGFPEELRLDEYGFVVDGDRGIVLGGKNGGGMPPDLALPEEEGFGTAEVDVFSGVGPETQSALPMFSPMVQALGLKPDHFGEMGDYKGVFISFSASPVLTDFSSIPVLRELVGGGKSLDMRLDLLVKGLDRERFVVSKVDKKLLLKESWDDFLNKVGGFKGEKVGAVLYEESSGLVFFFLNAGIKAVSGDQIVHGLEGLIEERALSQFILGTKEVGLNAFAGVDRSQILRRLITLFEEGGVRREATPAEGLDSVNALVAAVLKEE